MFECILLLLILPVSQSRWTTVKIHARTRKILSQTRRERPMYFIWKWNMRRIGQRGIISHAVYIFGILTSEAFTKACGGCGSKEITYLSLDHRHRLTLNINLKTLSLFSSQKSQKIDVNQIVQTMQARCGATKLHFLVPNDAQDLSCFVRMLQQSYLPQKIHLYVLALHGLLNKNHWGRSARTGFKHVAINTSKVH